MCDCHTKQQAIETGIYFLQFGNIGLIFTLFITGLVASFTHCIGMCGPIAISQMSIKLMQLPNKKISQYERFKTALIFPYYIGKATSYNILLCIAFFIADSIKESFTAKLISGFFLLLATVFFIYTAINHSASLPKIKFLSSFFNKYTNFITNNLTYSDNIFKSYIIGIALGFIPCGIVYAAIALILSSTDLLIVAMLSITAFGIATFPGLFVISLLGNSILTKFKNIFNYLYSIIMLLNAYLIFQTLLSLFI